MSEAPTSVGASPSSGAESHSKGAIRRVSKTRQNSVGSSHREDVFTLVPTKSEPSLRKGSEVSSIEPESASGGPLEFHRDSLGPNHVDSPKITRKFIHNWRQACDRTKDRTKELLKRWRTLPDGENVDEDEMSESKTDAEQPSHSGWSVHVWSTWVKREPNEQEVIPPPMVILSKTQNNKLTHFFTHLLDWDRDETISECDFDALSERFRHFADWSTNSPEYFVLKEVEVGFQEEFLFTDPASGKSLPLSARSRFQTTSLDDWLLHWSRLIYGRKNIHDLPLWLQYFAKIIFQVINKSGSDVISRDELRMYYSTFLGLDTQTVGETLDLAYNNMTSNGEHPLNFRLFKWCFTNFILGKNPHGCGQYLFGPFPGMVEYSAMFPIDYSAMNTPPECLEQYSPFRKSKRHSVIV